MVGKFELTRVISRNTAGAGIMTDGVTSVPVGTYELEVTDTLKDVVANLVLGRSNGLMGKFTGSANGLTGFYSPGSTTVVKIYFRDKSAFNSYFKRT